MEDLPNNQEKINEEMSMEWDLTMAAERKEREKQERLNRVIEEASEKGKEAFDYQKFTDSYWRKNAFSEPLKGDEGEKMESYYKKAYYLEFPNTMTIEEFAAELEKRDESLGE